MPALLPHRFLFRYSFPVRYERKLPKSGKRLLDLSGEFALPKIGDLDAASPYAELRLAWNERGLAVSVEVRGKKQALKCDPRTPDTSDGLRLFIDTRNTQNIHRASRYCHQFCLLPAGGGPKGDQPWGAELPILRAREEAPLANPAELRLSAARSKTGYLFESWLPSAALNGFDPEEQPRLGFYYALRDAELGEQYLTIGPEFPFAVDPSLWSTLELVKN
jgi:hypothetical protein